MYTSNSDSYTHLILALGIVRERMVWDFITSHVPLAGLLRSEEQSASAPSGLLDTNEYGDLFRLGRNTGIPHVNGVWRVHNNGGSCLIATSEPSPARSKTPHKKQASFALQAAGKGTK